MNSFLVCQCIISIIVSAVSSDRTKLTALSNVRIAELLYRRIRDMDPDVGIPNPLDPCTSTKDRICHHITGNSYFENSFDQHQVNMSQVGLNFREEIPSIFELLYEPCTNPKCDTDVHYTNRTRTMKVYKSELDQETVEENVFVCLTHEMGTEDEEDKFFIYFASKEYNLSDNTSNSFYAGRFLFIYTDEYEDEFDLFAVVEEPATSSSAPGKRVELDYLHNRANHEPAKTSSEDPICKLSRSERLRVCTLGLSSAYFENELKFTPEFEYVERASCSKREITFQDEELAKETQGKYYEEWMIRCKPDKYYTKHQSEYFLSRVYNSEDQVFVYRRRHKSKIIIENLFDNVRFKI